MTLVRRPTLLDFLILIAAAAVAMGMIRESHHESWWYQGYDTPGTLASVSMVMFAILVALTVAVLMIRLRRPRPGLRRLGRQPGFVASLTASSALAILGLLLLVSRLIRSRFASEDVSIIGFLSVGFSVVGSWLTLALGGRWASERGWIDRMGRLVGILWLAGIGVFVAFLFRA